jgi:hypothetical protein
MTYYNKRLKDNPNWHTTANELLAVEIEYDENFLLGVYTGNIYARSQYVLGEQWFMIGFVWGDTEQDALAEAEEATAEYLQELVKEGTA